MPGCTEPPECSEAAGHRTAAGKERERERLLWAGAGLGMFEVWRPAARGNIFLCRMKSLRIKLRINR